MDERLQERGAENMEAAPLKLYSRTLMRIEIMVKDLDVERLMIDVSMAKLFWV